MRSSPALGAETGALTALFGGQFGSGHCLSRNLEFSGSNLRRRAACYDGGFGGTFHSTFWQLCCQVLLDLRVPASPRIRTNRVSSMSTVSPQLREHKIQAMLSLFIMRSIAFTALKSAMLTGFWIKAADLNEQLLDIRVFNFEGCKLCSRFLKVCAIGADDARAGRDHRGSLTQREDTHVARVSAI
jgi:hypothetical protein